MKQHCASAFKYELGYVPLTFFSYFCKDLSNDKNVEECTQKISGLHQKCLQNTLLNDINNRNLAACEKIHQYRNEVKEKAVKASDKILEHSIRRNRCRETFFDPIDIENCQQKFDDLELYRLRCDKGSKIYCDLAKFASLELPLKSGRKSKAKNENGNLQVCENLNASQAIKDICNHNVAKYRKYRLLCLIDNQEADCQIANIMKKFYIPRKRGPRYPNGHPCSRQNYEADQEFQCIKDHAVWKSKKKLCSTGDLGACEDKRELRKKLYGSRDQFKESKEVNEGYKDQWKMEKEREKFEEEE